jgi:hypothetical protein
MSEMALRNLSWIQIITNLKSARSLAENIPEYPEMNVAIIEINNALDGMEERIRSIARTTDKNFLIRAMQIRTIGE